MAKYRPIYVKIWSDPDFLDYTPELKLLFMYLCTNEHTTESGIYAISPRTIANETGIPYENVCSCLSNNTVKNLYYDKDAKCIFIRKFLKYNGSGRPELLTKSITNDCKQYRTRLWLQFLDEYPRYEINIKPLLNGMTTVTEPLANPFPIVAPPLTTESPESPPASSPPTTPPNTNTNTNTKGKGNILLANPLPTIEQPLDNPLSPNKEQDRKKVVLPKKKAEPDKLSFGEGGLVKLTQEEYDKLLGRFGLEDLNGRIERLATYIGSTGRKYQSHYMTILKWSYSDRNKNSPVTIQGSHPQRTGRDNWPTKEARRQSWTGGKDATGWPYEGKYTEGHENPETVVGQEDV